jgi:hypothetical protein
MKCAMMATLGLLLSIGLTRSSRYAPALHREAAQRRLLVTLLIDLLAPADEAMDGRTAHLRFEC